MPYLSDVNHTARDLVRRNKNLILEPVIDAIVNNGYGCPESYNDLPSYVKQDLDRDMSETWAFNDDFMDASYEEMQLKLRKAVESLIGSVLGIDISDYGSPISKAAQKEAIGYEFDRIVSNVLI